MEATINFGSSNHFQISAQSFSYTEGTLAVLNYKLPKLFFPNFIILLDSGKLSVVHCASDKMF